MHTTRLEKQVEKMEAELKEKKAQMALAKRKERGGQLVALGIVLESAFRRMGPEEKTKYMVGPSSLTHGTSYAPRPLLRG